MFDGLVDGGEIAEFFHKTSVFGRVCEFHKVAGLLYSEVAVVADLALALDAVAGGHENHAVCSAHTIDGC